MGRPDGWASVNRADGTFQSPCGDYMGEDSRLTPHFNISILRTLAQVFLMLIPIYHQCKMQPLP